MRCIDADKLKDKLYSLVDCDGNECLHIDVVIDVIDNEPEADVREYFTIMDFHDKIPTDYVRENVRGEWIVEDGEVVCSECGEPHTETNFCPNCGARMGR